jgi:hypothetical protein
LFLFITVVAVCLGVGLAAPGLGILLAVLSVPAFVRASAWAKREEAAGRPADVADRVGLFIGSIGLVFVIALAGCAAFLAACWVSCAAAAGLHGSDKYGFPTGGGAFLWIGWITGGCLAIALVVWLFWKTWPRRRAPRK